MHFSDVVDTAKAAAALPGKALKSIFNLATGKARLEKHGLGPEHLMKTPRCPYEAPFEFTGTGGTAVATGILSTVVSSAAIIVYCAKNVEVGYSIGSVPHYDAFNTAVVAGLTGFFLVAQVSAAYQINAAKRDKAKNAPEEPPGPQ